jgi:hypothetical protein
MWQHHIFVCALFLVQGGKWTAVHLPMCQITHHNEIFIILISDFSQEIYALPDDDMQCAIEKCRSSESVLMYTILN